MLKKLCLIMLVWYSGIVQANSLQVENATFQYSLYFPMEIMEMTVKHCLLNMKSVVGKQRIHQAMQQYRLQHENEVRAILILRNLVPTSKKRLEHWIEPSIKKSFESETRNWMLEIESQDASKFCINFIQVFENIHPRDQLKDIVKVYESQ